MRKKERVIKFEAKGNGNVSLPDLVAALQYLDTLLVGGDRIIGRPGKVRYEVLYVQHGQNYDVAVEAIPCEPQEPLDEPIDAGIEIVGQALNSIDRGEELSSKFDRKFLDSISKVDALEVFERIRYPVNGEYLDIAGGFKDKLQSAIHKAELLEIIEKPETCMGSVRGVVKRWKGDNQKQLHFHIVPDEGVKLIKCTYPPRLNEQVAVCGEKYLEVFGLLKYQSQSDYVYEIEVDTIEVLSQDYRPDILMSLKDSSPEATGNLSAEDFLKGLRNGDC